MKRKGYYLSIEALLSMALLGLLLTMPLHENRPDLTDLHVFKKENDLLALWAIQPELLSKEKLAEDFGFAFPGKAGEVYWNGKIIAIGKKGKEAVSSKAVFFDKNLKKHEIRLVVFKNYLT